MLRIAISFIASFFLLYIESVIVMEVFGYTNGIQFNDYSGLVTVMALNFFLIFSIMTQLTPWFMQLNSIDPDEEENETSTAP